MTRLYTTGWETGDISEVAGGVNKGATYIVAVDTTPTARTGTYILKCSCTSTANGYRVLPISPASTDIWVRFAYYTNTTANISMASMTENTGAPNATLNYDAPSNVIRLYRGSITTSLATAPAFALNSWHVVEWRLQITSVSTGSSEVWVDGVQVIAFSGDVCQTATPSISNVFLGTINTHANTIFAAYDDVAVNDTSGTRNNGRPGDGRIELLLPSGAGSSTQLTRGGTDTGANYSQVNERPPSMSQYVASANVGDRDLYAMSDSSLSGAVNLIELLALANNSDAGAGSLGLTLKSGATTNEATAQALSSSAGYYRTRYETDPNTSADWTPSAVQAIEAGVTVR